MAKLTPQDWLDEIDRGLAYRKLFAREEAWRKNELNYFNSPASHTARGQNLVFEMGDTLLGSLTGLIPEITVTAEHPAAVDSAPIVESVDNNLLNKLKISKHVSRSALNAYLYSRAILKIGYDSEFGWSPRLDIGSKQQPYGISLSRFDRQTGNLIENKNVQPGMPWVSACLPHDIVVPWGVIDLEDSPWIAHRVVRLNDDVKKDPKYKNTSSLKSNMSIEDFVTSYMSVGAERVKYQEHETRFVGREKPRAIYNELWEIHDRRTMAVKVVSRDHLKFLRDERDAVMLACGMPFVTGTFVEHTRSFWSTPLAYYLGQLQADEYDIAKQSEKQRRISVLKFIAANGLMSEDKLQKLISGDVGAVEFANIAEGLRDRIVQMPTGQLYDFQLQSNQVRQNARSVMGFSRNQTGEFDVGTRRTKGEAMIVAAGSQRRENPRLLMVRNLYVDTVSKCNQLIFAFWKTKRPVLVDREWRSYTGDEIKGEYLYDLSLSSKRDLSKAERKAEALMLLGQLMPLLGNANPQQIYEYLANAANDPAFEKLLGFVRGERTAKNAPV